MQTVSVMMLFTLLQCKSGSQVEMQIMMEETECIALAQKLRLFEMRAQQSGPAEREVEAMMDFAERSSKNIADLRATRNTLHANIHALENEFVALKKEVIAYKRSSATGRKMAVFDTASRSYSNITIQSVTEAGVEIKHSSGTARITPMQLNDAQLDEFGLSVETARDALAAEAKFQQDYITNVDRVVAKQQADERSRADSEQASRLAAQTIAAYRAPATQSALQQTPQTKVYRVRSSPRNFFYYYNPGYNYGSCRHTYKPERINSTPIYPTPRTPYFPTP